MFENQKTSSFSSPASFLFLDGSSVSEEVPFSLLAHNVVLATGTHDIPARLGVEGESLPFVCHSFWELEAAISRGELDQSSDPVLVVGAGLTAADAVLAAHHLNTPVYHAFRRSVTDPGLIFNQLPKLLYPEYHKVSRVTPEAADNSKTLQCLQRNLRNEEHLNFPVFKQP